MWFGQIYLLEGLGDFFSFRSSFFEASQRELKPLQNKKAATPTNTHPHMKGAKGSQHHFGTQEGGHTGQVYSFKLFGEKFRLEFLGLKRHHHWPGRGG